jgi:catechol 2,3-dioxygenase-like lactoylglutathione lyase family enzyme
MIRTRGLTHLALAVRNAERAFRFYEELFGMVRVYSGAGFVQAQTPGSWDVLVFEERSEGTGQSGGIAHFGFRLESPGQIERAVAEVVQAGGTITSQGEFCPGEPYVFFTDLDGYQVEVWYELPTPVDPAAG